MAAQNINPGEKIYALVNYEDPYVQPLILAALKKRLPASAHEFITSPSQLPSPSSRFLQWVQYESIDFDHLMEHSSSSLSNAYVIRKALIRKHYLSTTIANWITKYPDSVLKKHVKPSVEFEVDYALDVRETYQSFALACFKAGKVTQLLQAAMDRNYIAKSTGWPSWVRFS